MGIFEAFAAMVQGEVVQSDFSWCWFRKDGHRLQMLDERGNWVDGEVTPMESICPWSIVKEGA